MTSDNSPKELDIGFTFASVDILTCKSGQGARWLRITIEVVRCGICPFKNKTIACSLPVINHQKKTLSGLDEQGGNKTIPCARALGEICCAHAHACFGTETTHEAG